MQESQYICDRMVGKLCRHLRILGLDAPQVQEPPMHLDSHQVLLTRRRKLLGRPRVLFVEHDRLDDQLSQVFQELGLSLRPELIFSRCLDCNQPVEPVRREEVWGQVPDFTYHNAPNFTRCPACAKVFWPGSHGRRARARLEAMLKGLS